MMVFQDAKEDQIKEHFGQFGEFETATLKTDMATGRTKVIDDESDYFAADTDKWQSTEQRKKLKEREKEIWEQKHGSRLNKKYTFDFAGKTVVEAGLDIYDPSKDEKLQEILESHKTNQKFGLSNSSLLTKNGDFDDTLVAKPGVQRPTYVGLPDMNSSNAIMKMDPIDDKHIMRIQDSQLQVMAFYENSFDKVVFSLGPFIKDVSSKG